MKLYTAIGERFELRDREATVICNGNEKILSPQEFILWDCLIWHILPYEALYQVYCKKIELLRICPEMQFDDCLCRMLQRHLVRAGTGDVESEALYDLIAPLDIFPLRDTLFTKLLAFFQLLVHGYGLKIAQRAFSTTELDKAERDVLSVAKRQKMNVAEMIRCTERGIGRNSSKKELLGALYADSIAESAQVLSAGRFSPVRRTILDCIKSLCQKQKIVFIEPM